MAVERFSMLFLASWRNFVCWFLAFGTTVSTASVHNPSVLKKILYKFYADADWLQKYQSH